MIRQSKCKRCGEAVFWAKTANDKNIPMDWEPSSAGEHIIKGHVLRAGRSGPEEVPQVSRLMRGQEAVETYSCHFETCTAAQAPKPKGPMVRDKAYYDAYFKGAKDAAHRILMVEPAEKGMESLSLKGISFKAVMERLKGEYDAAVEKQ
ncbi:MAG: hypothetical protein ACR2P5_06045 [Gammaproteobacteria bacterium]